MNSGHPSDLALEAWHAGEPGQSVAAHVTHCVACQARVGELDAERQRFLARCEPSQYVQALRVRAVEGRGSTRDEHQAEPLTTRRRGLLLGAVLTVAASVALTWAPARQAVEGASQGGTQATEHDAHGLVSKGQGTGLTVIRLRDGEQTLQRRSVLIAPGDKLRLSFQLPRPRQLTAGVLADDGSWLPLFSGEYAAGRHIPDATLQIDARPESGRLLFGSAEEVATVRNGRSSPRVEIVQLVWRAGP